MAVRRRPSFGVHRFSEAVRISLCCRPVAREQQQCVARFPAGGEQPRATMVQLDCHEEDAMAEARFRTRPQPLLGGG